MIDVVYAIGTERVQIPDGPSVPVMKGTHWPVEDPVVRARPELFTPDPRYGLRYTAAPRGHDVNLNEVEEATANPGERRNVRRG